MHSKVTLILCQECYQTASVNLLHSFYKLFLDPIKLLPWLHSDCSPDGDETVQAINIGICGHIIQHLDMVGSGTETGEEKAIRLM